MKTTKIEVTPPHGKKAVFVLKVKSNSEDRSVNCVFDHLLRKAEHAVNDAIRSYSFDFDSDVVYFTVHIDASEVKLDKD